MTAITFVVDDREVIRALRATESAVDTFMSKVADVLVDIAGAESAGRGITWHKDGDDAVAADQFYAHFLARGTGGHGPEAASRMAFVVDGGWISATHVGGITADPFHERAVETAESRVDEIMRLAMAAEGVV